jgi:hypothetical protein
MRNRRIRGVIRPESARVLTNEQGVVFSDGMVAVVECAHSRSALLLREI